MGTIIRRTTKSVSLIKEATIVGGTEKVLVSQEKVAENQFKENTRQQQKVLFDLRSKNLYRIKKFWTPKNIQVKALRQESVRGKTIKVSLPHIKNDIPLFIIFRALGIVTDREIVDFILINVPQKKTYEVHTITARLPEEASSIITEKDAQSYMQACQYDGVQSGSGGGYASLAVSARHFRK